MVESDNTRFQLDERILVEDFGAILGTDPDICVLRNGVKDRLDMSDEQVSDLVRDVVKKVNMRLFPALNHLELLLAEGCNLACSYCFEGQVLASPVSKSRVMRRETIKSAIDLFFEYARDEKELEVTYFGGEPTLNYKGIVFATKIIEAKADQTGQRVHFGITTNGLLLDDVMLDYFAAHRIWVLLSIDGLKTTHDRHRIDRRGLGTFDRIVSRLRELKRRQPWVGVKMTVMPSDAYRLCENVIGLHELGVNQFIIGHATGVVWHQDDRDTLLEQISELGKWYERQSSGDTRIDMFDEGATKPPFFGCRAGRNSIAVRCDGSIGGCSRIITLNSDKVVGRLGDVSHGLYDVQERKQMVSCERLRANCNKRGIGQDYLGGCFSTNYEETMDLYDPSIDQYSIQSLLHRARSS